MDRVTRDALASFKSRLAERYGKHLKAVYLFGSRARGDNRPDSDADVAIFLDSVQDPLAEQLDLIEEGYPILLETGINIQPWVFEEASLQVPSNHRAAHLVETVQRDGIAL
ncbi:MAG: nucleotidyltransferase domain-containing protein [Gammaproteobacteria bacterium]